MGFSDLSLIIKCKLLNCKTFQPVLIAKVQNFNYKQHPPLPPEKKQDLPAQLSFKLRNCNALSSIISIALKKSPNSIQYVYIYNYS